MKVIQMTEEDREIFQHLDPFGKMHFLRFPGAFALAATMEQEEYDIPAGLIIVRTVEDALSVEWLYAAPEYRGQGIGSELLQLVFEEAKEREVEEVSVRISENLLVSSLFWDPERFFLNDVFRQEDEELPEWHTTVDRLGKLIAQDDLINEKAALSPEMRPLSEMNASEKKAAAQELKKELKNKIPEELPELMSLADERMSFLLCRNGSYAGILLIQKYGDTWHPFLLEVKEEKDAEKLARTALYYSEDHAKPKEEIRIECSRPATEKLLEKLRIPADVYQVAILYAEVKEYEKQLQKSPMP